MELLLNDEDARTLRDFLRDHFHDLQLEVARTETKDLRHLLLARQELIKRLLVEMDRQLPA
jgi:arsenate reductase-like glutaredoxin family protein